MCSPSGLILILIASLYYNCLLSVIVAADDANANKTDASKGPSANAALANNNSYGGRFYIYYHNNKNDNNTRTSADDKMKIISTSSSSTLGYDNILNRQERLIDLTRKHKIHLNGFEIDENSLLKHLKEHEKELIFGKNREKRAVKLVHLSYRPDAEKLQAVNVKHTSASLHRHKRSAAVEETTATTSQRHSGAQQMPEVSLKIKDNEHTVNLRLRQTPQLIDDAFVFIRRYANSSQLIEDSHKLVAKLERCFYHNENSALDLCDDYNMRGIFHYNNTDFIIHPLPERFGNSSHIILESEGKWYDSLWPNASQFSDVGIQFEPDLEEFQELPAPKRAEEGNVTRFIDILKDKKKLHHKHHVPLNLRFKPRHHQHRRNGLYQKHCKYHNSTQECKHRQRRHISSAGQWQIPDVLHIETAIFVDSDLFKHMAKNFPKDTGSHLIRFVLAMINGVQLLYHHPSLGRRVNFVLKRLEILEKDPSDLRRSSDIDVYLSNFCKWQNSWNPPKDSDPFHYDHAVILTGLDLYVVGKNGKVISQVVGLAPVAGMCISTSSCTINEGKHFESVFVVAHEIGHNLGMRHDTSDNSCDPTLHIMSPTLGSGKTTWSKCSRTYLNTFLEKSQSKCLYDRGKFTPNLDHSADGLLPGERFEANLQCMLKYGKDSLRARTQTMSDICRDLHCQRDRYTWTSHPALEGTSCGENMWCRNGQCIVKRVPNYVASKHTLSLTKPAYDKAGFLDNTKVGHLLHEYQKPPSSWSEWSEASDCDSGCLYGPSKRLGEGSSGLVTYTRQCLDHKRRCLGRDRKYQSCIAKQCYSVPIITIENYARRVCESVQKFDSELTGEGEQIVGNIEESCKVYCRTKTNGTKSRRRTFPDGTTCRSIFYGHHDPSYCIQGRCEKFSCDNVTGNYYKIDPIFCKVKEIENENAESAKRSNTFSNHIPTTIIKYRERNEKYNHRSGHNDADDQGSRRSENGFYGPTTVRNKYENEVALRPNHGQNPKIKINSHNSWNKYTYHLNDYKTSETLPPVPTTLRPHENEWIVKSGCHSSCMLKSKGVQVVVNRRTGVKNIQLCTHSIKPCERLQTPIEFAESTCSRYKLKVRGLSGHGTQIAASVENPDRSCRVGCQDEFIKHRFYLVNGKYGHFPLGTKCSATEERYCVNGKCLEFGADNIPLQQSHISLALFRNRRSLKKHKHHINGRNASKIRRKRSFLYFDPVNITETLTQDFINGIVNSIIKYEEKNLKDDSLSDDQIEFTEPIHYSMNDELIEK
ncbi:A disintegrin and metalloproteinase with thrombospondin motifs 16 isoform X1 [Glossina fuscipes]|uniref:A disintegrin and metalloproteinase with thrombospondin motifs 16 isoform X1 n=1 Tax=Glossina fuscipes TaxID=7396 RepID=A0A9C6DJ86_9MUSC|nr:A disintegrin and metalloproteinase with thrombospondin motifs 16 isoform X1 [Glossina fuscipes]XP_037887567.1 A disintegrin and metalloproteinase with thrombospondin motifs 16 isoform X1 [Glossina fuscipes]